MHDLDDIYKAVGRVEKAIKDKPNAALYFFWGIVFWFLASSLIEAAWHSKWRYATQYQLSTDKIFVAKKPHDCDFVAAPIGNKYCEYQAQVSTTRWARSEQGDTPIVSSDEGKTWNTFTPDANAHVPKSSTVEAVYITWEKKEE